MLHIQGRAQSLSCENKVDTLHEDKRASKTAFHMKRFCICPHFETVTKGNSRMACYCISDIIIV